MSHNTAQIYVATFSFLRIKANCLLAYLQVYINGRNMSKVNMCIMVLVYPVINIAYKHRGRTLFPNIWHGYSTKQWSWLIIHVCCQANMKSPWYPCTMSTLPAITHGFWIIPHVSGSPKFVTNSISTAVVVRWTRYIRFIGIQARDWETAWLILSFPPWNYWISASSWYWSRCPLVVSEILEQSSRHFKIWKIIFGYKRLCFHSGDHYVFKEQIDNKYPFVHWRLRDG